MTHPEETTLIRPCISTPDGGFVQISAVARMSRHSHEGQSIVSLWTARGGNLGLFEFSDELEAIAFANQFRVAKGLIPVTAPAVDIAGS